MKNRIIILLVLIILVLSIFVIYNNLKVKLQERDEANKIAGRVEAIDYVAKYQMETGNIVLWNGSGIFSSNINEICRSGNGEL